MNASAIHMPRHRAQSESRLPSPIECRILPRVWATASLASASDAVQQRKRPHCLRLVRASEAEVQTLPPPRIQRSVEPGLEFYRKYTEGLLRRYMMMSFEKGRSPSLLGRELFRGKVSNCKVHGFDDVVIFVHDVGTCLKELDPGLRHLVRRIALEEYTQPETAAMLGIGMRTVARRYAEAIDKLTRLLIDRKILKPMMAGQEENLG
jgi:hypothetical protein